MQNTTFTPAVHPICAIFPSMPDADMAALAESIRLNGLRHPITLYQGQILDGRHRYHACKAAGVEPRYQQFTGDDAGALALVIDENLKRRHLDISQRAMVAGRIDNYTHGGNRRAGVFQEANLPLENETPNPVSIKQAADDLGVSERSVKTAKSVIADADPDLIAAVDDGRVSVNDAYAEVKRVAAAPDKDKALEQRKRALDDVSEKGGTIAKSAKRQEQIARHAELAAAETPMPTGRYSVILADPPWRYEFSATTSRAIESHYPSMALDEICALPISDLAADDAVLYLWATAPKLREALAVMDAWGFEYKSNMVWVKRSIGMGYWARGRHEHLLIGVKGAFPAPPPDERPDSVIEAPRREHSQKPDEAYELLERLYPNEARLELFARTARFDWQAWGNEAYANK